MRAVAQLGRAPRSGRGGRGFKSHQPDDMSWSKHESRRFCTTRASYGFTVIVIAGQIVMHVLENYDALP
jgi:hypothetical protein